MNVRHLAKLAGVSPATVSMALRDSPRISVATKARIVKLAKDTGYEADGRIVAMMRHLRQPRALRQQACFGVMSFYDRLRPWEQSQHLARIYAGMVGRATDLGYRLDPLWLKAPKMTPRRFADILGTRGIEGLLCFGSPDFNEDFPAELTSPAVVTIGLSIRTPLHRVTSHFYNDTLHALHRVRELGYRRPGLVLGMHENLRSAYAHNAAYLGWCDQELGEGSALPVLRMAQIDAPSLETWLGQQRPDVVLFVHLPAMIAPFQAVLRRLRIAVPNRLGVLVLSHLVEGTGFTGLQQHQNLMGAWAVELLVARIANGDHGIPATARIEMVESRWIEGGTLRRK